MYKVNVKERLKAGTRGGLASTLVSDILSVLTITTPLLTLFKKLRPDYMLIYLADFCSTLKILCKSTA